MAAVTARGAGAPRWATSPPSSSRPSSGRPSPNTQSSTHATHSILSALSAHRQALVERIAARLAEESVGDNVPTT